MHQSHYTFSVDDALQQAFNRAARQHNHDAAELLRGFMRAYIAQPTRPTTTRYKAGYKPLAATIPPQK